MTDTLCSATAPAFVDRIEGPTHALRVIADSIECVRAQDGRLVMAFPPEARLLDYVYAFASRDAFAA